MIQINNTTGRKFSLFYFFLLAMMIIGPNQVLSSVYQSKVVKGVVKDINGETLIGVNVVVKEVPTVGTVTDLDGVFSLNLPEGAKTLLVSFIGYQEKEISIGKEKFFNIILDEDNQMLDEVQVIAYGTQKKVTITGALSSMGNDELLKTPVASVGNALSGRMPGLSSVQYSGEPGADDPVLFIRGTGTLGTGDSSPLILVDGVERSFSQLDPNEIENITVLKDASATAVFGVRGANGVILITTKRGEKGKAKVSVSTSVGVQMPTRLLEYANSYQWASYYNEAQLNDGVKPENLMFSEEALNAFKNHSNPLLYPDVDWQDYLFKEAAIQSQHNVSISGGTEGVRYFVSAGILTQDGILEGFDADYNSNFKYKRYNYRANLDFDLSKTTKLAVGIGGRVEDKNRPISKDSDDQLFRFIYRASPMSGAGVVDGKWIKANPDYLPAMSDASTVDGLDVYYGRGYKTSVNNVLNTDLKLTQNLDFITKGLSMNLKGAYNSNFIHSKNRSTTMPYYMPVENGTDIVLRRFGDDAVLNYSESRDAYRDWYAEFSLNYQRKFGLHNVSALALYNQSKEYYPVNYPEIPTGYVGLVGRVTYDYATKYLFDFNVGYNGSENFAPGKRYGLFPAASVGWLVTEEKFMKKQSIVSYLKLRASYGVVGNDKFGTNSNYKRFLYLPDSYLFNGTGYNFGTNVNVLQPGAYEGTLNNSELTWEKAYKQNYGIDSYFFNDRLKINFDYFLEHRTDILLTRNAPTILGTTMPVENYGIVDNHGYELSVEWNDKINSDFNYYVNFNLSYAKNKIVEMDEVIPNEDYLYQTGRPVGQPFVYDFWGFYDETANDRYKNQFGVDIADHGIKLEPGDCVYVDANKDGVIDGDDMQPIGYTNNPQYSGGVTLGFSWKSFSFSMLWNYAWNTSRILNESFRIPFGETMNSSVLLDNYLHHWTNETAATAQYPRASFSSMSNNYIKNSDLWLVDASYLRLKNIEISYNIKGDFIKKIKLNSMRVFLNGYNLLTFDKLKVADPESRTSNRPDYPLMRIFNVGLKLNF